MEIKERKENKVLNRVEISFSWRHDKKATPSRQQVMDLVRTLEPGSNPDWIVVKDCVTRFGQPLTTVGQTPHFYLPDPSLPLASPSWQGHGHLGPSQRIVPWSRAQTGPCVQAQSRHCHISMPGLQQRPWHIVV